MTAVYGQCDRCGEAFHSERQAEEHECLREISCVGQNIIRDSMKGLAKSFKGIPVKVDPALEGGNYYICISQELLMEMEKHDKKPGELKFL